MAKEKIVGVKELYERTTGNKLPKDKKEQELIRLGQIAREMEQQSDIQSNAFRKKWEAHCNKLKLIAEKRRLLGLKRRKSEAEIKKEVFKEQGVVEE